jgi:hypothetical protein
MFFVLKVTLTRCLRMKRVSCREEWLAMAEHSAPEYEQVWTPIADADGDIATATHTPTY